ncbi:MAG: M23 family metallopeptidase [Chitinophagaceae bacterium]
MRLYPVHWLAIFFAGLTFTVSCSTSGPGLFAKKSPHEQYGQRIDNAGLRHTAMGRSWFEAAAHSLAMPLTISIPYQETGYFAAENPRAVGLQFRARQGEKLQIRLDKRPAPGFTLYLDLWEPPVQGSAARLLIAADSTGSPLEYEIKNDGSYVLRIQPELLKGGEYTLTISSGPSLAFPVPEPVKATIGSFWGVGRDRGARKHEGIDIFAPFRTPVIASAAGRVTRVNENNLGGKVVWLRPTNKDFTLYYAHLDTQIVRDGDLVQSGDTVGLMGNTGNAKSTSPHLHFGIYAVGGAVDPLPFVNTANKRAEVVKASINILGKRVRSSKPGKLYEQPAVKAAFIPLEVNSLLNVEAATANWYKVVLPGGQKGFINETAISSLDKPLRRLSLSSRTALFDQPDSLAARKAFLPAGDRVNILASHSRFYLVSTTGDETGWIMKQGL